MLTRERGIRLAAAFVLLLPVIVALVTLIGRPWHPTDDLAIVDLRVRDVFSMHTPLTGLYSRPGWNHPGPAMFWMIGVISELTAHARRGRTRIGGTIFQGVALVWLVWVASSRGTRILLGLVATTALTYLGIGADVFVSHGTSSFRSLLLFLFLVCLVADGMFVS